MLVLILSLVVAGTSAETVCNSGFSCVPIRECPEARQLARLVKNSHDEQKKLEILGVIREKLCGERREYRVCCDSATLSVQSQEEVATVSTPETPKSPCETSPEIGTFNQLTFHPVSGRVVKKDEKTLVVCDFVYDGEGPDAFLIVGNHQAANSPNSRDAIPILPPNKSSNGKKRHNFKDKDVPILGQFSSQTLELAVPEGETASDLKWISVFCRDYDIDFGHAILNQ